MGHAPPGPGHRDSDTPRSSTFVKMRAMNRPKILVADDDPILLTTLSRGLRAANYDVLTASNGDEAVHIGCREKPDLAILDVRMPGIFGIEAARRLRERAGIGSLFLSAYSEHELVELATKEGALGYIVKPITPTQLIPAIRAALERAADLRRLQRNERHLTRAIESNREISIAVGMAMARFQLERPTAFETFRRYARTHQKKMADLAHRICQQDDQGGRLLDTIFGPPADDGKKR